MMIRHLGFHNVFKKGRHNGNYTMYKLAKFLNLTKKQNSKVIQIKFIFGETYMEFDGCHGNFKSDAHTILINQNLGREWINSYWKFELLRANRLFKTLKNLMEGCIYPPPPAQFIHPRVKRQPETRVISVFIYILGLLSNSTIIGANASYQYRLHQFLAPAVGLNP